MIKIIIIRRIRIGIRLCIKILKPNADVKIAAGNKVLADSVFNPSFLYMNVRPSDYLG